MSLNFQANFPLRQLTTFRVGQSRAKFVVEINDKQQLPELYNFASEQDLPVIVLGEGSNSIATDTNLAAIVAINRIKGIDRQIINDNETIYVAGAGEQLDDFVAATTADGMSGIEALSGVPGTVGAAPIQNVGAYGQEIGDVLLDVEVFDSQTMTFATLSNAECQFSYRDSIFKNQAKNRYFITAVRVKLRPGQLQPPFYTSLQNYIDQHQLTDFTPASLRQYILAVRGAKIPDYKQYPSAGSFFKNAIISARQLAKIETEFGKVPFAEAVGNNFKIPTGWLIDKAELKGKIFNGIKVDPNNALILINDSAQDYHDLELAVTQIQQIIADKFAVQIEPEPILLKI